MSSLSDFTNKTVKVEDTTTSAENTWSSQKVSNELDTKRDVSNTVFPQYKLSVGTTEAFDLSQNQVFRIDASTAKTVTFTNPPTSSQAMTVIVHIAGNSAVTWPASINWDDGSAPELGDTFTRVLLIWDGVEWTGGKGAAR